MKAKKEIPIEERLMTLEMQCIQTGLLLNQMLTEIRSCKAQVAAGVDPPPPTGGVEVLSPDELAALLNKRNRRLLQHA